METYPVHVVTGWLGNTPKVAMQHDLITTDEHFDAAVRSGEKAAQYTSETAEIGLQAMGPENDTSPGIAGACEVLRSFAKHQNGGDRIRTCDLEVMSLASYRAAPPRVVSCPRAGERTITLLATMSSVGRPNYLRLGASAQEGG